MVTVDSIALIIPITTAPTFHVDFRDFDLQMSSANYKVLIDAKVSNADNTSLGGNVDESSKTVYGFDVINLTGLGTLRILTRVG